VYADYYGFAAMPFQLTPDNRFFFGSSGHSRAIAHLAYGLAQEEGFVVVTGEVGAGKTTLVERLWSQLDRSTYVIARVVPPQVTANELLRLVAAAFGLEAIDDKPVLLPRLEAMLRAHRAAGRRAVLVVDEAQGLSVAALEELRMLSNAAEGGRALVQTILLGQPQFRTTLARPDLAQLRQRVLASYHLGPLGAAETEAYIEHRMTAAGWSGRPRWEPAAFVAAHRNTGGIPRQINRLCSRVLLYGALEESAVITAAMVETTAGELKQDLDGDGAPEPPAPTGANGHDLVQRLAALEQVVARRERVFKRLVDLLAFHVETAQ
jgi:general secretion pathway protein A